MNISPFSSLFKKFKVTRKSIWGNSGAFSRIRKEFNMAVIDVYQNQAQLGTPASNVSNVRPDMGGQMAVAKANAALTDTVVNGGQKLYEQIAVADVMKANNDYNMQMNKLQNELLQNKEENAKDNLTKYEEGRKKIINNIMQKGPSTLRGVLGSKAFFNTIDRDWTGQRAQMERYTMGEMEKYQDTQLNNQYKSALKDVAANWNDGDMFDSMLRRGEFMTAARYANYGPEKIKEASDKWKAAMARTAAQAAISADTSEGWARGGEILQAYGYLLDPGERMQLDKMISARQKSNDRLNTFEDIFAKFGNDIEGGIAALMATKTGTANVSKGLDFARGEEGKAWGSNQCANFVKEYVKRAGGDFDITSSLADGTYLNAERKGLTFTDRKQLRDGDIVYWQVDGSKYAASDNPDDVQSDSKAYKGITHVGVYDAKTGKVIQSGEHGVSAMDLDATGYHTVGYSHIGGMAMDAVEQEEMRKAYRAYAMNAINTKKMNTNLMTENAADEMFAAYNNGERDPAYFENMARRIAGNDYSVYQKLHSVAKAFSTSANYTLTLGERLELQDRLDAGGMNPEDLISYLGGKGCSVDTIMKYVKKNKTAIKNKEKGEGVQGFDWSGVMAAFYGEMGGRNKIPDEWKPGLERVAKRAVNDYIKTNNANPSVTFVMNVLKEALVKGVGDVTIDSGSLFEKDIQYNMAELANHEMYKISDAGNGYINVWKYGNSQPVPFTIQQFKDEMEGRNND